MCLEFLWKHSSSKVNVYLYSPKTQQKWSQGTFHIGLYCTVYNIIYRDPAIPWASTWRQRQRNLEQKPCAEPGSGWAAICHWYGVEYPGGKKKKSKLGNLQICYQLVSRHKELHSGGKEGEKTQGGWIGEEKKRSTRVVTEVVDMTVEWDRESEGDSLRRMQWWTAMQSGRQG